MTVKRGERNKIMYKCPGIQTGTYFHNGADWEWFVLEYDGKLVQSHIGKHVPYDPTLKAIYKAMQVLAEEGEG